MKKLQNPTTYFFEQAENTPDLYHEEIHKFMSSMIDLDKCLLCAWCESSPACSRNLDLQFFLQFFDQEWCTFGETLPTCEPST